MTEQQIFLGITWPLVIFVALYLFPISIWKFFQQVQAAKLGQRPVEVNEESSIPIHHVNFIDIGILLALVAYFLLKSSSAAKVAGEITSELLISNIVSQLCVIGFVLIIWVFRINIINAFGLKLMKPKHLLWCIGVIITAWGITALAHFAGYFTFLESYYGKPPIQEAVQLLQSSNDPAILSLITILACIGAPVAEEVLFRGYIYPSAKRFSSAWVAMIFSGILFAVIHYNLASFPTLLAMGILLALSYEKTRCLWVPIIAHCIFNSATVGYQLLSRFTELQP